jgi:hypothetical protein
MGRLQPADRGSLHKLAAGSQTLVDGVTAPRSIARCATSSALQFATKKSDTLKNMPFITVLALIILGEAQTSVMRKPLIDYWNFLAMAVGIVSVGTGWSLTPQSSISDGLGARLPVVGCLGRDEPSAFARRSKNASCARDRTRTTDTAGARHFCRGSSCILANLRHRRHYGTLHASDRMVQGRCSLFYLGCRSSYRDNLLGECLTAFPLNPTRFKLEDVRGFVRFSAPIGQNCFT